MKIRKQILLLSIFPCVLVLSFVWLRPGNDQILVRIVDAQTGLSVTNVNVTLTWYPWYPDPPPLLRLFPDFFDPTKSKERSFVAPVGTFHASRRALEGVGCYEFAAAGYEPTEPIWHRDWDAAVDSNAPVIVPLTRK